MARGDWYARHSLPLPSLTNVHVEENWLLVFDNAEDFKDISGLVPDTIISHSGVLVTTQLPNFGPVDLPKLLVKPFDSTEGSELLLHQVGRRQGDDNGVAKAQEISELVGGLPLHLVTMGGFITQTKCSFQEFIETFHDFLPFEPRGARAAFRYDKNPAAVNDIGLSKLESEPRQLLNILAFLNPRVSEKILLADHEHAMLQFLKPGNRTQYASALYNVSDEADLFKISQDGLRSYGEAFSRSRYLRISTMSINPSHSPPRRPS